MAKSFNVIKVKNEISFLKEFYNTAKYRYGTLFYTDKFCALFYFSLDDEYYLIFYNCGNGYKDEYVGQNIKNYFHLYYNKDDTPLTDEDIDRVFNDFDNRHCWNYNSQLKLYYKDELVFTSSADIHTLAVSDLGYKEVYKRC